MFQQNKIAVITGGASGIGFSVAQALSERKDWTIHLLDRDVVNGKAAANIIAARFHETDVRSYESLAACFKQIFEAHGRLNFVFANAGIAIDPKMQQHGDLSKSTSEVPPAPSLDIVSTNLHSVIFTTQLAQHYFRRSIEDSGPRSIIVTASAASLYASPISPIYCASKFGVLGWVRSIAPNLWKADRISISAICPGIVRTNITPAELQALFPEEIVTPMTKVVEVVLMILEGRGLQEGTSQFGQVVEISGDNYYHRKQHEYCDNKMASVMDATY